MLLPADSPLPSAVSFSIIPAMVVVIVIGVLDE